MDSVAVPPIVGRALSRREQEKFDRMAVMLADAFASAGYDDVRFCDGSGKGEDRRLSFFQGTLDSPFVSLMANEFRESTSDELMSLIARLLPATRTSRPQSAK